MRMSLSEIIDDIGWKAFRLREKLQGIRGNVRDDMVEMEDLDMDNDRDYALLEDYYNTLIDMLDEGRQIEEKASHLEDLYDEIKKLDDEIGHRW